MFDRIRFLTPLVFIFGFLVLLPHLLAAQTAIPTHSFVLTDEQPYSIVVDAAHNQLFVSVAEINRLDVYSLVTHELIDRIAFPSPAGMALTDDGTRLVVGSGGRSNLYAGSGTEYVTVLDVVTHRVTARYAIPKLPGIDFDNPRIPDSVVVLANDVAVLKVGTYDVTSTNVIKLDLKTGVFSRVLTPFTYQVGEIQRAGPTAIVVVDSSNSGAFGIFDVITEHMLAESAFSGYFVGGIAVSADGTRLAVRRGWNQLHFFDAQLHDLGYVGDVDSLMTAAIFSGDGSRLYVSHDVSGATSYYDVIDTNTQQSIGRIAGAYAEHGSALPVAIDPNGFIIAESEHGFYFVDATPRTLSGNGPVYSTLTPTAGSVTGGTAVAANGAGFTTPSAIHVGTRAASQLQLVSNNTLNFTTPAAAEPGAQDVIMDFASGWRAYLPQAFSYGPSIVYTDMNAGPTTGGTKVRIVGYGFGYDASRITVTVGGRAATIDRVYAYPGISPWILPTHSLYVTVPDGTVGAADIVVTTPDGAVTLKGGFEYYAMSVAAVANATAGNIIFDRWRNRLIVGIPAGNLIRVFDATTLNLVQDIGSVTDPLGMSISPDGSRLVVASGSADQLAIVDLQTWAVSRVQLTFPFAYGRPTQVFPQTVAVAGNGKALVGVPDYDMLDNAYLLEVDLATGAQTRLDPYNIYLLSYLDLRQLDGGNKILLSPIGYGGQMMAVWDAASEKFTEVHRVNGHYDVAMTDDQRVLASGLAILSPQFRLKARAQSLSYTAPATGDAVYGLALHPGGGLLIQPHVDSLWIFDANTGTELKRMSLPAKVNFAMSALTLSHDGSRAHLLTDGGLLTVDLGALPLTVGTVVPAEVSSAGASTIMVRGSGFEPGMTLFVNEEPTSVQFVDSTTLQVAVPAIAEGTYNITVKALNGRTYTKSAALLVFGSQPAIIGTSPTVLDANVGDVPIVVFGRSFPTGSIVSANGIALPTTYNSDTALATVIPRNMVVSEGTVSLTVTNPSGVTSSAAIVDVKYPPGVWSVGTTDLNFGLVHVGTTLNRDLSVYDTGWGPLFNVSIGVDGTAFSQTNDCSTTLYPTTGCTVHVSLSTSTVGKVDDVLHLRAKASTADVGLHATLIPAGPYLQVAYTQGVQQVMIGDRIDTQVHIFALDSDVTVTKVTTSDRNVLMTSPCATVTVSGCDITITYLSKVVGTKDVSIAIESNASNSLQTATLKFEGISPLRLETDHLALAALVGQTGGTGLSLTNYGRSYTAQIQSISITGPFTLNSQCGASLAPSARCQIIVNFAPTNTGAFTGKLTIVVPELTIDLPVSGNAMDFTVGPASGAPATITTSAGQAATLPVSLAGIAGFASGVNLSCTTNIPVASCSVNPVFVQIDSSGAKFPATLTISTTKRGSAQSSPSSGLLLTFGALASGMVFLRVGRRRGSRTLMLLGMLAVLGMSSCGGGGSNTGSTPPPIQNGTPAGTYTATITAAFTSVTPAVNRTMTVNVVVQ
jgi:hypothetical protein